MYLVVGLLALVGLFKLLEPLGRARDIRNWESRNGNRPGDHARMAAAKKRVDTAEAAKKAALELAHKAGADSETIRRLVKEADEIIEKAAVWDAPRRP